MSARLHSKAAEYNLTEHCNLRCGGCNHASPQLPTKFADLEEYRRDILALASVLHVGEFKLVGGEPLLHPQLLDFLRVARSVDIGDKLVVFTNGLLLARMPEELWELTDCVSVSIYPGIKYKVDFDEFDDVAAKHNVVYLKREVPEFELAMINTKIEDPILVRRIFDDCKNKDEYACHTIHDGRYYKCAPAPFMKPRLELNGVPFENRESDGVRIRDNSRLFEELEAYLGSREPLLACQYCLGTSGPIRPHRQLRPKELREEMVEDHAPFIEATRLLLGPTGGR